MAARGEQRLVVRKLRASAVYKLLLLGLLLSMVPLGVGFGIAGYFGADTVKWSGQAIHGAAALWAGPAISAFVAVFLTVLVGTLACLGLWLLSWFRPVTLRVVPAGPVERPPDAGADEPLSG